MITITREVLDEVRALRLYHWRRVTVNRNSEAYCQSKGYTQRAEDFKRKASFHLGAVQTLNSFFDVGDTAERDDSPSVAVVDTKPATLQRNYIGQKKE